MHWFSNSWNWSNAITRGLFTLVLQCNTCKDLKNGLFKMHHHICIWNKKLSHPCEYVTIIDFLNIINFSVKWKFWFNNHFLQSQCRFTARQKPCAFINYIYSCAIWLWSFNLHTKYSILIGLLGAIYNTVRNVAHIALKLPPLLIKMNINVVD